MKLVVTTKRCEYGGYSIKDNIVGIDWKQVEVLIFNSCVNTDVDTILEISKAGEVVEKVIYINSNIDSVYFSVFSGINADIYDNEDVIYDEDILDYYVEEYKNTGETVEKPNKDVDKMSEVVKVLGANNESEILEKLKNPMWLKAIESAMQNVETSLVRTDEANVGMVELFSKTSEIIDNLQEGQEKTNQEIKKLSEFMRDLEEKSKSKNQGVFEYPTFKVPNTVPKVLFIKVDSPCTYLLSFLGAYQHYLKMTKQKTSKLLIASPKLKLMIQKYSEITRLSSETIHTRGIDREEIETYVTFEPKSVVLSAFFNMKVDLYIVVDMLYGPPLIEGARVERLDAVNSFTDMQRFKVDAKRCIISSASPPTCVFIPRIPNYRITEGPNGKKQQASLMNKRHKYFETCGEKGNKSYNKLDTILSL